MKKTIKFAVVVAIACMTQIVNAQKLSFPAAWEQYRSQMTFSRSQDLGNGNWRDVYLYQGKEVYNDGYCPTCTNTQQQPVNVNNDVNVVTYDREIELMKAQYQAALLELEQLKLQNQQAYQAELLKMQKRQGRWAGFTSFLNSAGSVLTGSGTVMQGKAAIDGKYGTTVNTNVFTTTGTQLPTPTDWGPVNNTPAPTPTPTPTPGNGPVFIPTWNTNSVPAGQTPPIIQQPGDWGPTGG